MSSEELKLDCKPDHKKSTVISQFNKKTVDDVSIESEISSVRGDSAVKSISILYPLIKNPKDPVDKKIDFDKYFNTLVQKVNN